VSFIFRIDNELRLTSWLFLKLLALIFFAAFVSLHGQIAGLVGPNGILPLGEFQEYLSQRYGREAWWWLPTLFWFDNSDAALQGATVAGAVLSLMLLIGVVPRLSLLLMTLLYLSLYQAGQIFLNFQWDYLLLEMGFLAIFLVRGPGWLVLLLFHWLLFRLRFLSGISKLLSGDPSWSSFTTLNYYFETQPLPHVGSWYAHHLPEWLLQAGTALVLFSELVVPFFIFLPRRFRIFAALLTMLIQSSIIATSNHNFVNLLTILLCLLLLDDRIVGWILPDALKRKISGNGEPEPLPLVSGITQTALALLIFAISLTSAYRMIGGSVPRGLQRPMQQVVNLGPRLGIGNVYHVFPTMQTERQELQIEGSMDGVLWKPYIFRYKPGPLERAPPFIVPHQPRLDWMIWFVPPQPGNMRVWFERLLYRLWQNEPAVTALLEHNPFSDEKPSYLRVLVYRYYFTTPQERRQSGKWWRREYLGIFPNTPPRSP
jgi:hypothetical protein